MCGYLYSDFGDAELKMFHGSDCITELMDWMISKEKYIFEKMQMVEARKLPEEECYTLLSV